MAAKAIQISNDGGTTWITLPGSEGSFNAEGESIDDTILGQSFQSMEVGLTNWSVSSNAIWKGFAGYIAELKKVGTSTVMTDDAMTFVAGNTYKITNTAKEIWNRAVTLVIEDNGVPVSAANILHVDYLFGQVTFVASYTPTTPVTVTGAYFPTGTLACMQSYTLTMTADQIDETCFDAAQANGGRRVFRPGLRTVAVESQGVYRAVDDWKTVLADRDEIIIEIDPAGDGSSIARGFFKLVTQEQGGAVGALEEESLNFTLYVPDENVNPEAFIPFGWRHTATTLNQAIQYLLTSWLTELNTYDVRYLPSGAPGQSPLDGVSGDFMVADLSLSGDLSSMNVFTVELQGTGGFTIV